MNYNEIKLDKNYYLGENGFTSYLEGVDPSNLYKGSELEGLDAFERQLKRFDIKVKGANSDKIEKFYSTADSSVLFPEYVSRQVQMGVLANDKISKILAATTKVDSLDYRTLSVSETNDFELEQVDEGATIGDVNITVSDKLTELKKFGKMLTASYEAIKFQRLDVFSLTLKRIGEGIANSEFKWVVNQLKNSTDIENITLDSLTYENLINLWSKFEPFKMTTIIANSTNVAKLLKLDEFRDATAGLDFHATGNLITPFGAEIIIHDNLDDNTIIALDKNYAIERVEANGVTTEFDKLIDRQLDRATVSEIVGFNNIYPNAVKKVTLS